jgi:hypothetical protein
VKINLANWPRHERSRRHKKLENLNYGDYKQTLKPPCR